MTFSCDPDIWSSSSWRCRSSVGLPESSSALIEPRTDPCRNDAAANEAALARASSMALPAASASACAWVARVGGGARIRLRHLQVDGGLVRVLGLELHVGLQPLDVALGPGHQAGEPADLLRRDGGLVLAVLDLLVGGVRRGRRHGTGRRCGQHQRQHGDEQAREQAGRRARPAAGGRHRRRGVWSPAEHVELLRSGLSRGCARWVQSAVCDALSELVNSTRQGARCHCCPPIDQRSRQTQ